MSFKSSETYGAEFAQRYIRTLETPYTKAKTALLAKEILHNTPDSGTALDIGGNIHATVKHNSLRSALESLASALPNSPAITYRVLDVNPAYFNIDQELENALKNTNQLYEGTIPAIVGRAESLPFKPDTLDTVIMADTIEHLKEPEKVLASIHQVLSPNGKLLLVVPAMYNLDQFPNLAKTKKKNTSHERFFTPESIQTLVEQADFSIESTAGIDYLGGLLYLVFTNYKYIPTRNPKTQHIATAEAQAFMHLRRNTIGGQKSGEAFNLAAIDERMNSPKTEAAFKALLEQGVHPLDLVPMVAQLDPALESSTQLKTQLEELASFVARAKESTDADQQKRLLQETPFTHWANSVYLRLAK